MFLVSRWTYIFLCSQDSFEPAQDHFDSLINYELKKILDIFILHLFNKSHVFTFKNIFDLINMPFENGQDFDELGYGVWADRIPGGQGSVNRGSVLVFSAFPFLMHFTLPCSVSRRLLFLLGTGNAVSSPRGLR